MQPEQVSTDRAPVDPHENLFVSSRKRFLPVYVPGSDGSRELILYCGMQEISFDEPDLFPWAEKLMQQDSFVAGSATAWATPPLDWPRVKGLLEILLDEGILDRAPPQKTMAQLPASAMYLEFLKAEEARQATQGAAFLESGSGAGLA